MKEDTHGAFVIGDKFSVFIDGIPDKCVHQWDGQPVHFVTDEEGNESCIPAPEETAEQFFALVEKLEKEKKWISGGAVTCSKCNKVFYPQIY